MVSIKDYVAGWLDSSIHDFLQIFPDSLDTIKYALITCLDSNLEPNSLLKTKSIPAALVSEAKPLGKGLLLPTSILLETSSQNRLFFGFDEVWFFPSAKIKPKPSSTWIVGPKRVNQKKLLKLSAWMAANSCSLALGDGEGLNFIAKARGLLKHLLGHSIDQPQPNVTFTASPTIAVAG